jgi:nucleotide-binding universal stress UspA family protein
MLNTALYAINFGEFFFENLDCFANLVKIGLKEIVLIHVININKLQHSLYSRYDKEDEEKIRKTSEIRLEDIKKNLEKYGFGVSYVIKVGDIADEIVKEADREDIDFIVLDKKAAGRVNSFFSFYDSPLYDIIAKSNKPVLITKRILMHSSSLIKNDEKDNLDCKNTFTDVVFATDFSESSIKAITVLDKIPSDIIKTMTLFTVIDEKYIRNLDKNALESFEHDIAEKFEGIIEDLRYRYSKEKNNLNIAVRKGTPCKEITDFIEQTDKKLLVIGYKGEAKEKFKEIFLGSTAQRLIGALPCSILVVK